MKFQHKNSLVGIIFVIPIVVAVMLNDTIGQVPTDILVNFLLAMSTGLIGLFWGLLISVVASIAYMFDGSSLPVAGLIGMILGNILYMLTLHISPGVIEHSIKPFLFLTPMIGASLLKYYIQFFTATKVAPLFFSVTESQLDVLVKRFGSNQLISALIGSIAGIVIIKLYKLLAGKKNEIQPL